MGGTNLDECPECGSRSLSHDTERAEVVCNGCGLVVRESLLDCGPDWRAFDSEQMNKRSHTGAPLTYTLHDLGMSTIIDWRNKDASGREIPSASKAQMYRLRKWQQRIRVSNSLERNLARALTEMDALSSRLDLPKNVREMAAKIYRRAVEKGLTRGRSIEGVSAASIYFACRQYGVPRTLDEISDTARLNRKEIGKTYRFVARELGLTPRPSSPLDYIERFGSELRLSGEVRSKAREIVTQAIKQMGVTSGRGPTGICAAALYIASVILGERKTQKEVAHVAGVTEVTIRNRYKEMVEKLNLDVAVQ